MKAGFGRQVRKIARSIQYLLNLGVSIDGRRGRERWVLYGTFEVAALGTFLKTRHWVAGTLVIARARCRKVSSANLGRGHEVRFDLAAQTAQVDHSVSGPEPIEGSARLIGLGLFIELSEVGNDCNRDAIRRARLA